MKRCIVFTIAFLMISTVSYCIKIDGKFWEWNGINTSYNCKPRILSRDRSGFDMQGVKLNLGQKFLYIYMEGKSVTGKKADAGWGAKKTSVRISFRSAQSPLNRVRIAMEPAKPGQIKISSPPAFSKTYGSKNDRFWYLVKYGSKYAFECKIPIYYSSKGIHVGTKSGPLVRISSKYAGSRNTLSEMLVNTVDIKTHRLVDTCEFSIIKGKL